MEVNASGATLLPLDRIDTEASRRIWPRSGYDAAVVQRLLALLTDARTHTMDGTTPDSAALADVFDPIYVSTRGAARDKFAVADGQHRVEACRRAGLPVVKARRLADDVDIEAFAATQATQAGTKLTEDDTRALIRRFLGQGSTRTQTDVARIVGVTQGYVSKVLSGPYSSGIIPNGDTKPAVTSLDVVRKMASAVLSGPASTRGAGDRADEKRRTAVRTHMASVSEAKRERLDWELWAWGIAIVDELGVDE